MSDRYNTRPTEEWIAPVAGGYIFEFPYKFPFYFDRLFIRYGTNPAEEWDISVSKSGRYGVSGD